MSVFDRFKPRSSTAVVARERLQIVLSHERMARGQSDLIALLREEILVAVAKHVLIERDKIHISMERGENVSSLEINIEIPHSPDMQMAAGF
jgi:cell division topological specificity factor